jgi:hypothetical protein
VLGEVEARMVFFAFGNSTLSVVGFAASESEPHAGPSVFPVCSRDESVCRNERKDLEARRVVRVACSRTLLPDAAKGTVRVRKLCARELWPPEPEPPSHRKVQSFAAVISLRVGHNYLANYLVTHLMLPDIKIRTKLMRMILNLIKTHGL